MSSSLLTPTTSWDVMERDNISTQEATGSGKPWATLRQPIYAVLLLSIAYTTVVVVGFLSNGVVIAVIYIQPRMRTVTNYFLANLATADILVCVFVLPITLLQNVYTEWWYGPTVCKVAPYLQGVAVSASASTLAAVALERYFVVFYPRETKMTSHIATVVICLIWAVPALLFTPWLLVYGQHRFVVGQHDYIACHADWPSVHLDQAFTVGVVFLTCYIIPLTFIAVFYVLIGFKVGRRNVLGLRRDSQAARSLTRSKTRILRMLIVVCVTFALSWLPLYSLRLSLLFAQPDSISSDDRDRLKRYALPVAQWLGAANSCVNPFIYCYFSRPFRRGIRQRATRGCFASHADRQTATRL